MSVVIASQATAQSVAVVTPDASNNLPGGVCRSLWVNDPSTVTVAIIARDDTTARTWKITGPGLLPVAAQAVRISGTTATDILALY